MTLNCCLEASEKGWLFVGGHAYLKEHRTYITIVGMFSQITVQYKGLCLFSTCITFVMLHKIEQPSSCTKHNDSKTMSIAMEIYAIFPSVSISKTV